MKTFFLFTAALLGTALSAQTTWYQVATGTNKKLNTIDFPSSSVGYIGGNDSTLLKSTDGGKTWNKMTFTGVTFNIGGADIRDIDFVTDLTGYMVVGPYGGAYKTTNGGSTWVQLTPAGNLCFFDALYFFDAQNGFIGGSSCFQGETIEKMTAGALATTSINAPTWSASDRVVDMDFLNNNFGLAVSHGGNIIRTTNGGLNWDSIPSGLTEGTPLTSVAVINTTLAYAGYNDPGQGFGLLRSIDGGLNWAYDVSSATFYYPAFLSLHEAATGTIYAGAQPSSIFGGLIFESTSGAWSAVGVNHPINDISSYSNVVFGVGDSGYVVVNKSPLSVGLSENKVGGEELVIYPNPTNDLLNVIVPRDLKDKKATLLIYSASGQIVHESTFVENSTVDISAYPAGLYIVELRGTDLWQYNRLIKR